MAEVAGRPFSSLVEALAFEPAGMRRSARIHRALPLRPDLAAELAVPYHLGPDGRMVRSDPPPPQRDGAAGGVITSASELARFDVALTEGRLLSTRFREQLWSSFRTPNGRALSYGLGWFQPSARAGASPGIPGSGKGVTPLCTSRSSRTTRTSA